MPKGIPKNGVNSGRFTKGFSPWNKGRHNLPKHSEDHKRKISETCKKSGIGQKKGYVIKHRYNFPKGDKHPHWKGGITAKTRGIRFSVEYKEWRKKVFERDNYTCRACGRRGYELHADHIKPFKFFPELVLVVENGRTLCAACHRQTPTYANQVNNFKREDFL